MKRLSIQAGPVCVAIALVVAMSPLGLSRQVSAPHVNLDRLFNDAAHLHAAPEVVDASFRVNVLPLEHDALVDYATIKLLLLEYSSAAILFEEAARYAPTTEQRLDAMMMQATAMMYAAAEQSGQRQQQTYAAAGRLLNRASVLDPMNSQIPVLRLAAWASADDQLEASVAEHHLRRMVTALEGRQVFLPAVVAVVSTTLKVFAEKFDDILYLYYVYIDRSMSLEEKREAILRLKETNGRAAGTWVD